MEPKTAKASEQPCSLYAYHRPRPSRTQGHHRHPVYLQNKVYGKIRDPELIYVCGTCHDNIHEWLSFLLGDARKPSPEPGRLAKKEALYSYEWFLDAMDAKNNPS